MRRRGVGQEAQLETLRWFDEAQVGELGGTILVLLWNQAVTKGYVTKNPRNAKVTPETDATRGETPQTFVTDIGNS